MQRAGYWVNSPPHASTTVPPCADAGPVAASWGWVLIVAMTLTVALPMAEICSSLPTTGGVYYCKKNRLGGEHFWVRGGACDPRDVEVRLRGSDATPHSSAYAG